jgi:hypothetical protein
VKEFEREVKKFFSEFAEADADYRRESKRQLSAWLAAGDDIRRCSSDGSRNVRRKSSSAKWRSGRDEAGGMLITARDIVSIRSKR